MVAFNSTTGGAITDAKGVAAQMVGFQTPNRKPQMVVDEDGNVTTEQPQVGYWSNAMFTGLDNLPNWKASLGYSLFRGQNTILGGGATGNLGMKAQWNPRTLGQFSSPEIFRDASHTKPGMFDMAAKRSGYSPFNSADMVNDLATSVMKKANPEGGLVAKAANKVAEPLLNKGILKAGGEPQKLLQRGTFSHISAASKISKQGTISAKQAGSMNKTIDILRGGSGTVADGGAFTGGMAGREAAMHYMANSASGAISSRVSGYTAGAVFGKDAASIGGNTVFNAAAEKSAATFAKAGMKHVGGELVTEAGEKVGMKIATTAVKDLAVREGVGAAAKLGAGFAARSAFAAVPVVNVAMAAWMVYDLAKFGAKMATEMVIKPGVHFAQEGIKSWKGQIDKAPFGTGFKDNSVLMTARQRGVMSISNSRLNARSILGNEAASIHAHFG